MIKVLIVDDQDLMLQGLSMLIGKEDNLLVVGTCHDGSEAVKYCKNKDVDVVLMDIRMPVMTGVEATKLIIENSPKIKIIILTTFTDDEYIFSSLRNGASGYLLKDAKPIEITNAIEKVYDGGTLINPDVATKLVMAMRDGDNSIQVGAENEVTTPLINETFIELTNRENDICHFLAKGNNNKEIGKILTISEGTVKNNITKILNKLDLRDRTQLALFALKRKI